jgi:hypothetical protein
LGGTNSIFSLAPLGSIVALSIWNSIAIFNYGPTPAGVGRYPGNPLGRVRKGASTDGFTDGIKVTLRVGRTTSAKYLVKLAAISMWYFFAAQPVNWWYGGAKALAFYFPTSVDIIYDI